MLWSACPVWLFAVLCECKDLQLRGWELCFLVVLWHQERKLGCKWMPKLTWRIN